jgi:hypothetical protein
VGNLTLTNWKKDNQKQKLSKETRFKIGNPFYVGSVSPGPGVYNLQDKGSLHSSSSRLSLDKELKPKNSSNFGSTYEKYKKVYYSELAKDFQNREGPGPGFYLNDSKSSVKNGYSFGRDDRKMSSEAKKDSPSPVSYRYEESIKKIKGITSNYKFGTSKRESNFSRCKPNFTFLTLNEDVKVNFAV